MAIKEKYSCFIKKKHVLGTLDIFYNVTARYMLMHN